MRIYISGGITDVPNYHEHFKKAEIWLKSKGYEIVNPANALNPELEKILKREELLGVDTVFLSMCDGIFMLHDWQKSEGAKLEINIAKALGKKIMYQDYFNRHKKTEQEEYTKAWEDVDKYVKGDNYV